MFAIGISYIFLGFINFKLSANKSDSIRKLLRKTGFMFYIVGISNLNLWIVRLITKFEYLKSVSIIILLIGILYILYIQNRHAKNIQEKYDAEKVLDKLTK